MGRPLVRQGRLGLWLIASALDREVVAERLGIGRRYLDHIAREDRRPSLAVAAKIEELTGGEIPATYFADCPVRSGFLRRGAASR